MKNHDYYFVVCWFSYLDSSIMIIVIDGILISLYLAPYEIMKVGMDIVPRKLHYTRYNNFICINIGRNNFTHQLAGTTSYIIRVYQHL